MWLVTITLRVVALYSTVKLNGPYSMLVKQYGDCYVTVFFNAQNSGDRAEV